nr:unnamed protein product [Gossypium raimondii]
MTERMLKSQKDMMTELMQLLKGINKGKGPMVNDEGEDKDRPIYPLGFTPLHAQIQTEAGLGSNPRDNPVNLVILDFDEMAEKEKDSLIGAASRWYNHLSRSQISSWRDLAQAFMKQYSHVSEIMPDKIALQNLEKKSNESFRQHAQSAVRSGKIDAGENNRRSDLKKKENEIWSHYLYKEKCMIYTDHYSLKYLLSQQELNLRRRRWIELLKDCDCVIEYHPSKANIVADALSRKSMTELRAMFVRLCLASDGGRLCVPQDVDLMQVILTEAQSSPYDMHLGSGKMYHDLREIYWWPRLKLDIMDFVARCFVCLKALYGRMCRTPLCWMELDEKHVVGPNLVHETEEKGKLICESLKAATGRQNSYADLKHRDIEFQVVDKVFLKVSPWKKVLRFGRKELKQIHDIFHVSMLRKYCTDPSHIMPVEGIKVQPNLTSDEEPIEILDQ